MNVLLFIQCKRKVSVKSASNISKLCIAITSMLSACQFIAGYDVEKFISDMQKAALTFDYTAMLGEPFAGEDSP